MKDPWPIVAEVRTGKRQGPDVLAAADAYQAHRKTWRPWHYLDGDHTTEREAWEQRSDELAGALRDAADALLAADDKQLDLLGVA